MRNVVRICLAVVLGIASAPAASATPSTGVTAVTLFQRVVGDTEFVVQEATMAPGGATGWHYHPGSVFVLVKAGTVTHYRADCSMDGVYHEGEEFAEESGPGYVHIGRNLEAEPLVLEVLYVKSADSPLAVDAPNPGCPFE